MRKERTPEAERTTCAKVWGHEEAPRDSGGPLRGFRKGGARARPQSGAEGRGESRWGFKQRAAQPYLHFGKTTQTALWRGLIETENELEAPLGDWGADSWRILRTLPEEQLQAGEERCFRGKTQGTP